MKRKFLVGIGAGSVLLIGIIIGGLTLGNVFAQTTTTTATIGFDKAAAAALAQNAGAKVKEIEVNNPTAVTVYEVEIIKADGTRAEVNIDAVTGAVVPPSTGLPAVKVTMAQAEATALAKYPGSAVVASRLEGCGTPVYSIEVKTTDGKYYVVTVDANANTVISSNQVQIPNQGKMPSTGNIRR